MKAFTILILTLMAITTFAQQTPPLETGVSQALAKWRAANYSDVRYKLNLIIEKNAPTLKGTIEISLNSKANEIILDWRKISGSELLSNVSNVSINGTKLILNPRQPSPPVTKPKMYDYSREHLIFNEGVIIGENIIRLDFESPIKTSGAAITRYVDKEDGAEYVYSLFVPSDASTAFPVFDQPDLKARFQLTVGVPENWKVISNNDIKYVINQKIITTSAFLFSPSALVFRFNETKPISTYVFAFAAGEFAEVSEPSAVADGLTRQTENSNKNASNKSTVSDGKLKPPAAAGGSDLLTKIYVRKSQGEKFKQHADEVFRLNRESVKYLEDWFDYKFPFPKYDLVLIPEFPFGGMEHSGATFLREDRIIFPTEPTKNDFVTRANLIFHEAAHQWFGDTVTMKWFDDLWLKEGFAEFMAYKTLEKVLPEYNAWKVFYERNKQAAYLTDVTRGTTPIYQEIPNLASAKSAYGNIVYRKAPSFLKQAEFYLGEKAFQTAVRAFLKKHEFTNATWQDLVKEFNNQKPKEPDGIEKKLSEFSNTWVTKRGLKIIRTSFQGDGKSKVIPYQLIHGSSSSFSDIEDLIMEFNCLVIYEDGTRSIEKIDLRLGRQSIIPIYILKKKPVLVFPNYQDYGYGIFLLDEKSRAYVLSNIQNEKDDFLRSMMWGSLWDAVRFYELAPEEYVRLVIKNINVEQDESTIATLLNRVSTAMNYYIESEPPTVAGGLNADNRKAEKNPSATADGSDKAELASEIEKLLIEKMRNAPTLGQKITYYRAFVSLANSDNARNILKQALADSKITVAENSDYKPRNLKQEIAAVYKLFPPLKTKDKFDIVTKLIALGDADGLKILAELEKQYTDDAAKRYAYAARAGIPTAENKLKYWKDFTENKELSESYIESAFAVWNTPRHSDLTLPYLEKALAELPNLKRNRKIFFVNGWLGAFIGGQKSAEALNIVNKFLADNPTLDKDLRLKILENADNLERAVRIREKENK